VSVGFVTRSPMTLDEALGELRAVGCTVVPSDDDETSVVRDILGNHMHLSEARMPETCKSLATASIKRLRNEIRIRLFEIRGGGVYVFGTCHNLTNNDPQWMAETLGMAVEDDEDHEIIMEAFDQDADEFDPDDDD
jgi:hypothetical protein